MEQATVAPHDVVLVAWALYRQLDLRAALRKLLDATARQLIIVAPDSDASQLARGETAAFLYVLGELRELSALAELSIVYEPQPEGDPVAVPIISWVRPPTCTEGLA